MKVPACHNWLVYKLFELRRWGAEARGRAEGVRIGPDKIVHGRFRNGVGDRVDMFSPARVTVDGGIRRQFGDTAQPNLSTDRGCALGDCFGELVDGTGGAVVDDGNLRGHDTSPTLSCYAEY